MRELVNFVRIRRLMLSLSLIICVLLTALIAYQPSRAQSQIIQVVKNAMVPMPDGIKLATTIYLPADNRKWPVVLIRTPYNRKADAWKRFADSMGVQKIGVVVQDTRGNFDSEGDFRLFLDERADGQATLQWIAAQPWSNGRIGSYGASALSIAQYMMAPNAPRNLQCQWAEVGTPDVYSDVVYQGGAYREELADGLINYFKIQKFRDAVQKNYLNGDFWKSGTITDKYQDVHVKAVHISGWYDIFSRGTINAFMGYDRQGGKGAFDAQYLVMGPWTHDVNTEPTGDFKFPNSDFDQYYPWMYDFFRGCLLDVDEVLTAMPKVTYYTMGAIDEANAPGNAWHTGNRWPPPNSIETKFYLQPENGLAKQRPQTDGADTYRYNPLTPVPTIGGNNLYIQRGPYDQRVVESRKDVLLYSTGILDRPVEVTGNIHAEIWITSDVPDTDIVVRLTDVYPDGRSILISDGIMRARFYNSPDFKTEQMLKPGEPYLLKVDLSPTSMIFNRGHQIRISITSSNSPRFSPNPNSGNMFRKKGEKMQTATISVLRDKQHPSMVVLPVVGAS